jgi:hypothetical protein
VSARPKRIPLDRLPDVAIASAPADPMLRDAAPGTAVQWRSPAWLVVAVGYQQDATAQRRLDALGLDARLFTVRRRLAATRVRPGSNIDEPAFPGYLIVRAAPHERDLIGRDYKHAIDGVLTAVGQPTVPAILSDHAMLGLLAIATRNRHAGSDSLLGEISEDGTLRPIAPPDQQPVDLTGETLLVVDEDSPLAGFRGECLRSAADRVVLLMRLLGGERRVTVDRSAVRRA